MSRLLRVGLTLAGVAGVVLAMGLSLVRSTEAAPAGTTNLLSVGCALGTLTVYAPTPGKVVTSSSLPITLGAVGYQLDARYAGTPNQAYVGHYHEILDGNLVDMTPVGNPNKDTVSMVGVTLGPHTLTLVPACNDHSMIISAAVSIPFTYAGPYRPLPNPVYFSNPPTISIVSPANGATLTGSTFTMTVNLSNFELSGPGFGKALVDGVGHWHIFVDQPTMADMKTMASGTSQAVSFKGVVPGWHTFNALLVNNQHMPLMSDPTGMASVRVFVQSSSG